VGWRFRQSLPLLPGVRLNVSKSGLSTSVGRPGATLNFSKRGTRYTVGLPGSGLSYTDHISRGAPRRTFVERPTSGSSDRAGVALGVIGAIGVFSLLVHVGSGQRPTPSLARSDVGAPPLVGLVTAQQLRCRAQPSTTSKVVDTTVQGTRLAIGASDGGWLRTSINGQPCWVSSQFVQLVRGDLGHGTEKKGPG